MLESLQKHGYDSTNDSHHLIVIGDMFDRGNESNLVLEYLYDLHHQKKATIILGNHDSFLRDFLQGDFDRAYFNSLYNGFAMTLFALSNIKPVADNYQAIYDKIHTRYPYLLSWLETLPLYLELGDYIFVHGGIDGGVLDWKTMLTERDFVWSREINLPKVDGKTVVAGHHRVATIRQKTDDYELLYLYHPEYFDILYEDGKILIDRFVEVSQELNVLILEI
jgi:serine/threonine protein phosphatase 1